MNIMGMFSLLTKTTWGNNRYAPFVHSSSYMHERSAHACSVSYTAKLQENHSPVSGMTIYLFVIFLNLSTLIWRPRFNRPKHIYLIKEHSSRVMTSYLLFSCLPVSNCIDFNPHLLPE